jgi:cation diffusion facilitator CzcD-associated flavoprotein CzcO
MPDEIGKESAVTNTPVDARSVAASWLVEFERVLSKRKIDGILSLFTQDGSWRDLVAFSWHIHSWANPKQIAAALENHLESIGPHDFHLDARAAPGCVPRAGRDVIEAFYTFATRTGKGEGVVRLVCDLDGQYRAWTLLTALNSIQGHEAHIGANQREHSDFDDGFGGTGYITNRKRHLRYSETEPTVIIVGAGQAGLSVAARLRMLGIDALVIDRKARIGDNWRDRYRGLRLHTETPVNHLPYLPFPETSPRFMSGAMFGDWLESYASIMELTVWTGTEFLGGEYNDEAERWSVRLRRADGTIRTLRPKYLVIATGLSDLPNIPQIKGIGAYEGQACHSSQFKCLDDYTGKSAVVFGAGTSGIDVAHDLCKRGAKVTVVQRGPMTVVNLDPTALVQFSLFSCGIPTEICDLMANADPYPVLLKTHKELTNSIRLQDKQLIDDLERAGFRTHYGMDDTGNVIQYFRSGGGYYLNVGGAELIIEGKIQVRQFEEVSHFTKDQIVWSNGSADTVDLVVFATGYKNFTAVLDAWFGTDVAETIGQVWGFDQGGELSNMYKRTEQPGVWFIGGGVLHSRSYSLYLALQIQACELGLMPIRLGELDRA